MLCQLTRWWKDQKGAAAVEAALMLPVLVTLTFGTISVGSILFVQNNIHHAARETARTITVPMSEAALVDVLGIFSDGQLTSNITFRKEVG